MLHLPRWLWLNHIPPGLDLTPEQRVELRTRVRAMRAGKLSGTGVGKTILKRLLPGIAVLILTFLVWMVLLIGAKLPPARFALANVLGIAVMQLATWSIIAWSVNRAMAPVIWRALNQTGFRVCEQCGYILDHLPLDEARCPECGTALHPPTASNP